MITTKELNKLGMKLQLRKCKKEEGQFLLLGKDNIGRYVNIKGDRDFIDKYLMDFYLEIKKLK